MRKTSIDGKKLDEDIMEDISDKATDVFNYLMPKRKDRSIASEDSDADIEEIKKRRKARYEALKEKYKD